MKVALLTMDNREPDKDYSAAAPRFGTAPTALLSGFASLPGVEVHVVSRVQKPLHIAAAMIRVAQDWELCQRMGEAAYKKGAVRNTWQDYGDRLLAEYAQRLKP